MNFISKKINKSPRKQTVLEVSKSKSKPKFSFLKNINIPKLHAKILISIGAILLFAFASFAIYKFTPAKTIITKSVLKTIGSDLKKDSNGYINILAVGIGGEGHDGGQLTDTIIVASINEKTGKVFMSSIPRDLYVKHENIISQRVNSVFENTKYRLGEELGMLTLSEIIGEFIGFPIHYYLKIDFQGLVDVVNAVGGIEVYNEETIYDPYYPGPNYSYETFSLPQGLQTLDGETALKFSRSRKTSSDFSRSNRQQQVIFAIKDKALQLNILSSPEKLKNLFQSVEKNLKTNLSLREITTLAGIASDLNRTDIASVVINDDFNAKGGFLYTPPRSLYNDAFVLLPADSSLSQIHTFVDLHRLYPDLMKNPLPIDLLNGTKTPGLATKTAAIVKRFGFIVNNVENLEESQNKNQTNTTEPKRSIPEIETSFIQTSLGKEVDIVKSLQLLFKEITKVQPIDPTIPDPNQDGLPASVKLVTGRDLIETLKLYDVYSSLAPIIEQAINENRAAENPTVPVETEEATTSNPIE